MKSVSKKRKNTRTDENNTELKKSKKSEHVKQNDRMVKEKEKRFSSVKVTHKSTKAKQKYGIFKKGDRMKKFPAALSRKKEKMLEARRKRRAKGKVMTTVATFIPIIIVNLIKTGNLESDVQYSTGVTSKERE